MEIQIKEETRIPGTDIILEVGDIIKIKEATNVPEIENEKEFEADVLAVYNELNSKHPGAFTTYDILSVLLEMFPDKYEKYRGKRIELNAIRDTIRQVARKKHLSLLA